VSNKVDKVYPDRVIATSDVYCVLTSVHDSMECNHEHEIVRN